MSNHRAPCPSEYCRSAPLLISSGGVLSVAAGNPGLMGTGRFQPCSVTVGAGNQALQSLARKQELKMEVTEMTRATPVIWWCQHKCSN